MTGFAERVSAELACPGCAAEVRVTAGARVYARVIHQAACPWLPRYQAGDLEQGRDYTGAVPCGVSGVTHRGPYKRDPDPGNGVRVPQRPLRGAVKVPSEFGGSYPPPDYKQIAEEAVRLLCTVGYLGLDPSKQRQLWQQALDMDRQLHPWKGPSVVWTEQEGAIDPPRGTGCTLDDLADACPGDHATVYPLAVTRDGCSLKATYRHGQCGAEWDCWWDPEASGWPLRLDHPAVAS